VGLLSAAHGAYNGSDIVCYSPQESSTCPHFPMRPFLPTLCTTSHSFLSIGSDAPLSKGQGSSWPWPPIHSHGNLDIPVSPALSMQMESPPLPSLLFPLVCECPSWEFYDVTSGSGHTRDPVQEWFKQLTYHEATQAPHSNATHAALCTATKAVLYHTATKALCMQPPAGV
jgi:hypothetical protein